MTLNSLNSAKRFLNLIDEGVGDKTSIPLLNANNVVLLLQNELKAFGKEKLQRLIPDIDLSKYFEDETLTPQEVLRVLNNTNEKYLDKELFLQAVQDFSEKESPEVKEIASKEKAEVSNSESSKNFKTVLGERPLYKEETKEFFPKRGVAKEEPIEVPTREYRKGKPVYRLDKEPSGALVVYCGDSRFQSAFYRFITEELEVINPTPVIIGGGLHAFGVQTFLPKNFKILWEQIKFFVKEGSLKRIIFINHEDCKWYKKMKGYHPHIELPLVGRIDLQNAAERVVEDFSGVEVESYFASIKGDEIFFERVDPH